VSAAEASRQARGSGEATTRRQPRAPAVQRLLDQDRLALIAEAHNHEMQARPPRFERRSGQSCLAHEITRGFAQNAIRLPTDVAPDFSAFGILGSQSYSCQL